MAVGPIVKHVIDAMADSAAKSEDFKTIKGTTVFHISKGVRGLGIFSTAVGLIFALLALFNVPPSWIGWLCFSALFDVLGLPLLIAAMICKVWVDTQRITYRNAVGISRSVPWEEIQCVYTNSIGGNIKICGRYRNLKIGSAYAGFNRLKKMIEQAHPSAFSAEAVLESEDFQAAQGVAAFRQSIAVTNVGIFIMLIGLLGFIPSKETIAELMSKIILIVGMGTMGLYYTMEGLVSRVYLEPTRLVYRNFCGMKTAIAWRDIRHVSTCFTNDRSRREYLKVSRGKTVIKIKFTYIAYDLLKSEIKRRRDQYKA